MPTPEHVEALADVISKHRLERADHAFDVMCERAERVYAAIVSNPAVQDAVLAALVEGGRLAGADWEAHYYRDVMDGKSTGDDT